MAMRNTAAAMARRELIMFGDWWDDLSLGIGCDPGVFGQLPALAVCARCPRDPVACLDEKQ